MRGRLVTPVVVLLVLTAFAVSDWPTGSTTSFWEPHPLFAGIVSGILVLAIGSVLVDQWLVGRAVRQWKLAQAITFKELGYAADEVSRGLQELLGAASDRPAGGAGACCAERAAEYDDALSGLPPEDHLGRLGVLLADSRWVAAAVDAIDDLKHTHRHEIARWAPVLLTTETLSRILDESAKMNERVFELQAPLRRLRDRPPTSLDLAAIADVREARSRWQQVLFEAVLLQERLMRAAVDPLWKHDAGRRRLTSEQIGRIEHAHRKLGPIKRPRGIPRPHRADVARGIA